jgi:HSP20 family protein
MSFDIFGRNPQSSIWARKVRDIMDEMLNRHYVQFRSEGTWKPATNVYESRDAYHVCLDLAGMDREQIVVECIDPSQLVIRGTRPQPRPAGMEGPVSVYVLEIDEGCFRRQIDFPETVDVTRVEANYAKGFLWIKLPRIKTV